MQSIKCMLVGDPKIGKTDLFLTFTTGCPAPGYSPTVFDTFTKEVVVEDGVTYKMALWDSSGDSLYDEIRPISYPHVNCLKALETDCFLICYSVDDRTSFESVETKWKPEVVRYGDGPSVPLILAGLKSDLRTEVDDSSLFVSKEEGESLRGKIGAQEFVECSTLTGQGVDKILQIMIESAVAKKTGEDAPQNPVWGFEDLKILVVGDSTTGKSSVLNAYTSKKGVKETHEPTTEIVPHYQDIVLDGIEYFLGIYDLPSAPEFLHDRIKEYEKASGIILCYAINDPFSFQNVENQWVPEIRKYSRTTPFIIIGNKCDLKKESEILIPSVDGEELMLSTGAAAFLECSAKNLQNLAEVFATAVKVFRKSTPLMIPSPVSKNSESDNIIIVDKQ